MRRLDIRLLFVLVTLATLALVPSSMAFAQAWVNAKGELSLALRSDFQEAPGVWHGPTLVTGVSVEAFNDAVSAEYVPFEHLAFGATLNANGVRYSGRQGAVNGAILNHGSQDNGSFHWNVTDLELDARYQAYDGAITLTPVVHFRTPVTSYEEKGYAAAGSHLMEGGAGLYLGRYGLGLEDLVLQTSYTFTYVEKYSGGGAATERYRVNRSDADLSLSYVINDKLIVGAGAAFRYTHDGFDLGQYNTLSAGDPLIMFHDPVLLVRYLAPTAIASYQLSQAWSLAARFAAVVWGESTSNAISFGLTLGWANNLTD
jgi:hypothetical protein